MIIVLKNITKNKEIKSIDIIIKDVQGFQHTTLNPGDQVVTRGRDPYVEVGIYIGKTNKGNYSILCPDYGGGIYIKHTKFSPIKAVWDSYELNTHKSKLIESCNQILEDNSSGLKICTVLYHDREG